MKEESAGTKQLSGDLGSLLDGAEVSRSEPSGFGTTLYLVCREGAWLVLDLDAGSEGKGWRFGARDEAERFFEARLAQY